MSRLLVALLMVVTTAGIAPAQTQVGRIVGRVMDDVTGEPVAGARIILFPVSLDPGSERPRGLVRATTDPNGKFELAGVPSGRWNAQVDKVGYVTMGVAPMPLMSVDVSAGTLTIPDIRLDRGGVITGHVFDAKGNGMNGALLEVRPLRAGPDGIVKPSLYPSMNYTNDQGEYRIAGLPPGRYIVVAQLSPIPMGSPLRRPPQAAGTYVPTYYPGLSDAAQASPIDVVRGATTNGIDFSLLSVATYQVSGVVVDSDGRPVAGAVAKLLPRGSGSLALFQSTPTGRDGTFRVLNVPPGTFVAVAGVVTITRNGNSESTSVEFAPLAGRTGLEFVVQGNNVTGLQVVLRRP